MLDYEPDVKKCKNCERISERIVSDMTSGRQLLSIIGDDVHHINIAANLAVMPSGTD